MDIVKDFSNLINPENFTFELYVQAQSIVMTRSFGWSLPYMMLVPFADNCNHFNVENYFELFNSRLTKRALRREKNFNNHEKQYFTKVREKINFLKHFKEDEEFKDVQSEELP